MIVAVALGLVATSPCPTAIADANAHVAALEYAEADASLLTCTSASDATEAELVDAHMLAGQIDVILGHDVAARGHFLWALHRKPDVALPADAPAKIATFFALIVDEAKKERAGAAVTTTTNATGDAQKAHEAPPPDALHYDGVRGGLASGVAATCIGVSCVTGASIVAGPAGPLIAAPCIGVTAAGATVAGAATGGNVGGSVVPAVVAGAVGLSAGAVAAAVTLFVAHGANDQRFAAFVYGTAAGVVGGVAAGLAAGLLVPDPKP